MQKPANKMQKFAESSLNRRIKGNENEKKVVPNPEQPFSITSLNLIQPLYYYDKWL
jgi:hypothetical protein